MTDQLQDDDRPSRIPPEHPTDPPDPPDIESKRGTTPKPGAAPRSRRPISPRETDRLPA
jgi:hypothetical protein